MNLAGRAALTVAGAVLALLAIPEAGRLAYTVTGAHWANPSATFRVNPNFTDAPAGTPQNQIDSIRLAADTWRLEGGSPFQFNYLGTTSVATVAADGVNAVFYSPTDGGGALAVCYWWTSGGLTTNFDIIYYDRDGSSNFVWATNPTASQFDIQGVGVHEFGHALGLGHSTVSLATMYPSVAPGDLGPRTLHPDDMAGVQSIYGQAPPPAPVVTGVSPSSGWIDGGTAVQVTGQWFPATGLSVKFGGASATGVVPVDSTRVNCIVPAALAGGPVSVEVIAGSQSGSLSAGFTYQNCRFTGPPVFDTWNWIEARFPLDGGLWYQGAVALGNQGFPINPVSTPPDLRIVPLSFDWVLEWTILYGPLLPYYYHLVGYADPTGHASFAVWIPDIPVTHGLTIHSCVLTGQLSAPNGVQSISTATSATF
jgi:hypothetical protein